MSTNIEWTSTKNADGTITKGETWNPISGCSKISAGCASCYAIKDAHRLKSNDNPKIAAKYEGTTKIENGKMNWTGQINLGSEDVLTQPMRWTRPRKIFVNSMSDLFHENVPDEWIDKIFAVMVQAKHHTFQILTKRPERMKNYLLKAQANFGRDIYTQINNGVPNPAAFVTLPLRNVWLLTSIENQETADERISHLLETPAAVRGLSVEPLLGQIEFKDVSLTFGVWQNPLTGKQKISDGRNVLNQNNQVVFGNKIDWVIAGGESGHQARPVHPDWVRSIRDQCVAAGVKFFFKQFGDWVPVDQWKETVKEGTKEFTFPDGTTCLKLGKKKSGRILDGKEWSDFPIQEVVK